MHMTQTISKKWMLALAAALSVILLVVTALPANAETTGTGTTGTGTTGTGTTSTATALKAPENIKQTSAFGSYAKISWDAAKATGAKYQIDVSQDKVKWETLATVGNTYYTVSKLVAGQTYYLRIRTVVGKTASSFSDPFQVIAQPGYISEVKQTVAKDTSITVSWSAAAGAGAYDVYIGTSDDNMKYKMSLKDKTKATIKGLKKNKTYIVKVLPFNISPSGYRTNGFEKANTSVRTTPGQVSGLKVTSWSYGSKNITVEWKAKDNADGYQVKFYNAAGKSVKTINTTSATATFAKAKADTFYKVKVRPYITIDGKKKYGAYNKTPVYPVSQPQLTAFKQVAGKLTLSWKPVEGATGYTIYLTTTDPNHPSSYVKVATVDKAATSYELTKFGNDDITVLENYYGYVVANKKVGSKTYSSKVTQAWYCSNN